MRTNLRTLRKNNPKKATRVKRKISIRKTLSGSAERPRLSVFRSAKHIYIQAIDDAKGVTLAHASTLETGLQETISEMQKKDAAVEVGKLLAARLKEKGIEKAVFDRNGFRYHGRVAAVADGARQAGLQF